MDSSSAIGIVLETLTKATSQEATNLKPAEQQLKEWETQPGFYSVLQTIYSNHSIDVNVRWLAVLYFKNGVDKYWRKTAPNAISEVEKMEIRARLISTFNEPVAPVATQLAVLISKVARLDCPREWHELIPTLLEAVKQPEQLHQQRALLTLHHVTKTLASKRLLPDRKLFRELTSSIFSFVLNLWNAHTENFLVRAAAHDYDGTAASVELSMLALKILRKQLVFGITEPEKVPDALMLVQLVFQRIKPVVELRAQVPSSHLAREKLEKQIVLYMKLLLDMQDNFPLAYVGFIKQSLELAVAYVFTDAGKGLLFERFIVQCMNLIKGIVKCDAYRLKKLEEDEDVKDPAAFVAAQVRDEFFTDDTVVEICKRLLSQYFLVVPEDLRMWEEDPEGYTIDEGGESWKFTLRPCTEVLFLALFHAYKEIFTPVLLQMVQTSQEASDPDDMNALLLKEAVYNAMGLAAFELFDEVDFDQWLTSHLLSELHNKHPRYKLIRRRVIWLIGQWLGVKLSSNLHPTVYNAILPLLVPDEDLVVRITAAQTLKIAVDDFEFKTENFTMYLESSFALLFQLLQQVAECDTKMTVLHVMSFIIERVGHQIQPYVSKLTQYLPLLWEESRDHNMLRCAILSTLVHLVQGVGSLSVNLYPFLLPIIQFSTDVSQPPHVYLLEDGIDLWYETLQNAPVMTKELLQLFGNMPELLDIYGTSRLGDWFRTTVGVRQGCLLSHTLFNMLLERIISDALKEQRELGTENLKTCFQIMMAYVLLGPEEFLQNYSATVFAGCVSLLNHVRPEGIVIVMKLVETIFKVFPIEGPQIFRQMMPTVLQKVLEKQVYPIEMSMYLSLLARIVIKNQPFFFSLLEQAGKMWNKAPAELLEEVLQVWVDRIDTITQAERRKLTALALSSLITADSSVVTDRFPDIVFVVAEVLHDVCREENGVQQDYLVMGDREEFEDETETEHEKRKRRLSFNDPVFCISLRDYTMSQLTEYQRQQGTPKFEKLMQSIDIEIQQQLQDFFK